MNTPGGRGWDIFETNEGFAIQRDDEEAWFESDADALNAIVNDPDEARACIVELLALLNEPRIRGPR